jgi:hypothetical protein
LQAETQSGGQVRSAASLVTAADGALTFQCSAMRMALVKRCAICSSTTFRVLGPSSRSDHWRADCRLFLDLFMTSRNDSCGSIRLDGGAHLRR